MSERWIAAPRGEEILLLGLALMMVDPTQAAAGEHPDDGVLGARLALLVASDDWQPDENFESLGGSDEARLGLEAYGLARVVGPLHLGGGVHYQSSSVGELASITQDGVRTQTLGSELELRAIVASRIELTKGVTWDARLHGGLHRLSPEPEVADDAGYGLALGGGAAIAFDTGVVDLEAGFSLDYQRNSVTRRGTEMVLPDVTVGGVGSAGDPDVTFNLRALEMWLFLGAVF